MDPPVSHQTSGRIRGVAGPSRARIQLLVAAGIGAAVVATVAMSVAGTGGPEAGHTELAPVAPAPSKSAIAPSRVIPTRAAPATTTTSTPPPPVTTAPVTVTRTTIRALATPAPSTAGAVPATTNTPPGSSTSDSSSSINYASTAPAPPSNDIPADPNLSASCRTQDDEGTCITDALLAFDNARAEEGIGPMTLPADFANLTPSEQLFVLVDSERVDRGLTPIGGELTSLDQLSASAAQDQVDPSVPSDGVAGLTVADWLSNWASTDSDLSAVYEWMYDDGLGSDNIDCTVADESGCWDHRDNILGFQNDLDSYGGSLSFGGATFTTGTSHGQPVVSVTMLTTWSPSATSGYSYTWDQAVADGAG
jgi:hypothetical protein